MCIRVQCCRVPVTKTVCGVAVAEQARHVFANVGSFYVAMESSWEHVSMSVFYQVCEWGR